MSESHAPARGAATLHDVAREAGVSLATASRVLNGSTRKVADSYRERVEAAAERLGYTANVWAQATARGNSAMVALLAPDIGDPGFGPFAAGVARGADEAGLALTVAATGHDLEREARLVHGLRGQRPRGVILVGSHPDGPDGDTLRSELTAFAGTGGRIVVVGPALPGARTVTADERGAARALGATLAGLGYHQAVIVAASGGDPATDERVAGFTEGLRTGGGEVQEVRRAGNSSDEGYTAGQEILATGIAAGTLVFAVHDAVAIGVMAAVTDAGRSVGPDVAVAGFDDDAVGRCIRPALTTVHVPQGDLGYRALRAAIDVEWDAAADPIPPLDVLVRASTPPAA